jgi:UDP-3-O-[3-hydroxymyristoyl] glucosamine N-acyltransferase
MSAFSLSDITARLGGEIAGDPATRVTHAGALESAGPQAISFLMQARHLPALLGTRAGAVILSGAHRDATAIPRIVCANPHAYFARVCALLHPAPVEAVGVHVQATVHATARLGANACIGAHAVVGAGAVIGDDAVIGAHAYIGEGAVIGAGTRLWPRVTVYYQCRIGARCIVHSGAVIGADGFGNAWEQDAGADGGGHWVKVPQIGGVIIGDDVEIGANTTIDRGAMEDTVIEDGVRLDNLIMVAHNVRIGAHTAIAACTGIAGSTVIGRYCRIGGAVGISGHLTVADHVDIAGKTFVSQNITERGSYSGGYPFEESAKWRRTAVRVRQLDDMAKQIKALEKRLAQAEGRSEWT